jgi:arylsulfatase A-like enzyme
MRTCGFRTGDRESPGNVFRYPPYAEPLIEHQALAYLDQTERNDSQPWLGYLSFTVPHDPPDPMAPYEELQSTVRGPSSAERERDNGDKWPGYAAHSAPGNPHFKTDEWMAQLRMLRQADDIIGRVMVQLRDQHELDNTIFAFLSDNGNLFGAHRLSGKRLPYTESIKVPALIRWTHHIRPGSVDRRLSANVDLVPTLLHAAGVTADLAHPLDGRDLFDESWRRRYLLTEHWQEPTRFANPWAPTWASLRSRDWQYIEYFTRGATIYREYYDLRSDPAELQNLVADGPAGRRVRIAQLHASLKRARMCVGDACS